MVANDPGPSSATVIRVPSLLFSKAQDLSELKIEFLSHHLILLSLGRILAIVLMVALQDLLVIFLALLLNCLAIIRCFFGLGLFFWSLLYWDQVVLVLKL